MLCGGNTVIMCGRCDMGRKSFFCRTHFFSYPPPPRKKISHPVSKFFSSPPPCAHPPWYHVITQVFCKMAKWLWNCGFHFLYVLVFLCYKEVFSVHRADVGPRRFQIVYVSPL